MDFPVQQTPDDTALNVEATSVPMRDVVEDPDVDGDMEAVILPVAERTPGMPKTMQQLAEANTQRLALMSSEIVNGDPQSANGDMSQAIRTPPLESNHAKEASIRRARSVRSRKRARSGSSPETGSAERPKHSRMKVGDTSGPIASVRTLRPRVPKSDAKKQQERELELAYRRAIEE